MRSSRTTFNTVTIHHTSLILLLVSAIHASNDTTFPRDISSEIITSSSSISVHKRDGITTYILTTLVGGNGGARCYDHFRENTVSYHNPNWSLGTVGLVTKLTIWWQNDYQGFHGIQVTYADETLGPVHGKPDGYQNALTNNPGTKVQQLVTWDNGQGTCAGRLRIVLSDGTNSEHGKDNAGAAYAQDLSSTSGLLTGIYGNAGDALESLGFTFIAPISNQGTTNVQFDVNLDGSKTGVSKIDQYVVKWENAERTAVQHDEPDHILGTAFILKWHDQLSFNLGTSVRITANVPTLIMNREPSSVWSMSQISMTSLSKVESQIREFVASCNVPARTTCFDTAYYLERAARQHEIYCRCADQCQWLGWMDFQ